MRKAEAEVRRTRNMEVSLLVKSFFEAPVEAVLQRMAGAGGRRPSVAEAREVARRARAARGCAATTTHNREPYDTLLYCPTSCPYRSVCGTDAACRLQF